MEEMKSLVFTRVDKAANCLCVMCKSCYIQLATDEMEGPGYSRKGVDLASIKSTIIKRQADFLRQEHLPIPLVRKQSDEDPPATILVPTDRLPVRYITAKLHKNPVATRGITACCGSPMDGVAKIVNACLAALSPVMHALWRDKCVEIGIFSDECWITSSGSEIIDIVRNSDAAANSLLGTKYYHRFETYDFEAMYPNLPDANLQETMFKLLESTFKDQSQHGLRSIELRWSYANDHTCPVAREASWSSKQPQPITANSKSHVWVGPDTIFRWLKCVLNEGCVQCGPHMYRQTSGVFMGTSPAPELANDFAFWHEEYGFLTHMVNEYKQYGPGRYPFEFISQYAGSTKRYIDDIITVSLGHTIGPMLQDIILQDGVFFGMYPTTVRDFDGSVRPSPISIVREQIGPSVHFLDMEIIQPLPGVCEVKMYDKRDNMPTLASYRKFPHIETTIAIRCKYAVLHSQLCRFSYRCTQRQHFIEAASRLIRDMYTNGYDLKLLRRKLFNFQSTFWKTSKILGAPTSKGNRRMFWHILTADIYYNATRALG